MKLPSIQLLLQNAKNSFLRFPLTIISAFLGTLTSIYLFEYRDEIDNLFPYLNILLTAGLGIPLFFCTAIYIEIEKVNSIKKILVHILSFGFLAIIYYSLPNSDITNNTSVPYIKYTIYNCIIHLVVSFIPYLKTTQLNGFWNYNKTLFIRICTSILYSAVLYLGLVFALFAVNSLFNIDLDETLYFDIFIVTTGLFNTWFFVSGIPQDLQKLDNEVNYPKGLKVFTQYILIPLLSLYLVILYLYVLKIIFDWNWPKGIVSSLITGVSILGIFTLLLIYPFSKSEENSWIKKLSKSYYFILIPLVIVLFLAVKMRIDSYGITINRYVIVLLGIWLTLVSLYFCTGRKNIKFIPQSLAILMALMSFGPWGMFSVSERSQSQRLFRLLESSDILKDGKIQNEVIWISDSLPKLEATALETNMHLVSDSIHNEIYSIINYLDDHHGFNSIASIYSQNIDSISTIHRTDKKYYNESRIYLKSMGLKGSKSYRSNSLRTQNLYFSTKKEFTNISGYDILFNTRYYGNNSTSKDILIDGFTYQIERIDSREKTVIIHTKNGKIAIDLHSLIDNLVTEYGESTANNIPQEQMTIRKETSTTKIKLELDDMRLIKTNKSLLLNACSINIFIAEN